MKKIILSLSIFFACIYSNAQTIKSLKGTWIVSKFYFCGVSAMGDVEAKQWLNKKLVIGDKVTFEFSKIANYRKTFKDEQCTLGNSLTEKEVARDLYFHKGYNCNPLSLKLPEKIILVSMKCDGGPFSEFIMKSTSQIIISWDGVFFELNKM